MPASRAETADTLTHMVQAWVDDPENPVVYTEVVDGRRAVRMAQDTRDFTTVWFEIGERSVKIEAYVVPAGEEPAEQFRQCLVRNRTTWRTRYCLDEENGIVLRARIPIEHLEGTEVGFVMAEIYEQIEVAFRPLVRALRAGKAH